MARPNQKRLKAQKDEEKRKHRQWVRHNGGGTARHKIKCEGCGRTFIGGEIESPMTCPICDSETALYEPQLR